MQVLTGLQIGAIYVLIALGLTLIFGTLGVANFAHGALFMIGAYLGWLIAERDRLLGRLPARAARAVRARAWRSSAG